VSPGTAISFVGTSDPKATKTFYEDVLGLDLTEASPFALVFSDAGHMLRIQIVPDHAPATFTAYGWKVADIAKVMANLAAKGVSFLQFSGLDQDKSGVWMTPDGARIAWFNDPSGNVLSLTQFPG